MEVVLQERYHQLVQTLMVQLEGRNPFNVDHCRLVATYADLVARQLRLDPSSRKLLQGAAEVHTLGVLLQMEEKRNPQGVPITNLGACSGREKSMAEREKEILERILGPVDLLRPTIPLILARHTWFAGHEAELSIEARLFAVVDAFVDLATPKSHRNPLTLEEVVNRLREAAGTQFDPQCVEALATALKGEQEQWGAGARARQFETARYRHWLALGHFHRQCGEVEWAHRCYRHAFQTAESLGDPWLRIQAVFGSFMVYMTVSNEYERARDLLNKTRPTLPEGRGKVRHWFMMMWGLLVWTADNDPDGEAVIEEVAGGLQETGDLAGLAAAYILLGRMTLVRGAGDPIHIKWLSNLMHLLAQHDLFDIVVQFRPQCIPLLLNAIRRNHEAAVARDLLTRLGEPCQDEVLRTLDDDPAKWHPGAPGTRSAERAPKGGLAAIPTPVPSVTARLRIMGLGPLQLECGERRVGEEDWPVQKAMRLFALVAFRRATFADEELMDRFWQDRDEVRARGSLRNAIHQIRTVLADVQEDEQERVTFDRRRRGGTSGLQGDYWLDTEAFEASLTLATKLSADGNAKGAATELKAALQYYRGDFLPGLSDEWVEGTRTHFNELHLRALHLSARSHLQLGDAETAELLARQALRRDDLREEIHVTLLETLLAQRRKAEALRHYQDALAHFRKEIGLASPSTLMVMYDKIVR